jgi:hypothetical protein
LDASAEAADCRFLHLRENPFLCERLVEKKTFLARSRCLFFRLCDHDSVKVLVVASIITHLAASHDTEAVQSLSDSDMRGTVHGAAVFQRNLVVGLGLGQVTLNVPVVG